MSTESFTIRTRISRSDREITEKDIGRLRRWRDVFEKAVSPAVQRREERTHEKNKNKKIKKSIFPTATLLSVARANANFVVGGE